RSASRSRWWTSFSSMRRNLPVSNRDSARRLLRPKPTRGSRRLSAASLWAGVSPCCTPMTANDSPECTMSSTAGDAILPSVPGPVQADSTIPSTASRMTHVSLYPWWHSLFCSRAISEDKLPQGCPDLAKDSKCRILCVAGLFHNTGVEEFVELSGCHVLILG